MWQSLTAMKFYILEEAYMYHFIVSLEEYIY